MTRTDRATLSRLLSVYALEVADYDATLGSFLQRLARAIVPGPARRIRGSMR